MKVFLGGTCNESTWRETLISMLSTEVNWYDPVVPDWAPECMADELRERATSDICLYVITPKMAGTYAIAEVVDDSNKRPTKTVFVVLEKDGDFQFTVSQKKSLMQVSQMVGGNGAKSFFSLEAVAVYLNGI